jgi:hypothetical protein
VGEPCEMGGRGPAWGGWGRGGGGGVQEIGRALNGRAIRD